MAGPFVGILSEAGGGVGLHREQHSGRLGARRRGPLQPELVHQDVRVGLAAIHVQNEGIFRRVVIQPHNQPAFLTGLPTPCVARIARRPSPLYAGLGGLATPRIGIALKRLYEIPGAFGSTSSLWMKVARSNGTTLAFAAARFAATQARCCSLRAALVILRFLLANLQVTGYLVDRPYCQEAPCQITRCSTPPLATRKPGGQSSH